MVQFRLFANLIIFLHLSLISGENVRTEEEKSLEPLILNKLLKPTDSDFEREAKKLIAQYILAIAEQTDAENDPILGANASIQQLLNSPRFGRQETAATESVAAAVTGAATAAPVTESVAVAATQAPDVAASGAVTPASNGVTFRPGGPSQGQILGQVNKILENVYQGNVSGIIDQSLGIRNNTPVRNLVNGIISLVLCTPWDRVLGRCPGQSSIG